MFSQIIKYKVSLIENLTQISSSFCNYEQHSDVYKWGKNSVSDHFTEICSTSHGAIIFTINSKSVENFVRLSPLVLKL